MSVVLGASSDNAEAIFWIVMTVLFLATTTYMGITWYKVRNGTRKIHKSYLAYLTTKRFRKIWELQKTRPSYYSTRFWLAFALTVLAFIRATNPNLR